MDREELITKLMQNRDDSESQKDLFQGEVIPVTFTVSSDIANMLMVTFGIAKPMEGVTKFTIEYFGRDSYLLALNDNYFCMWSERLPRDIESSVRSEDPEAAFQEVRDQLDTYKQIRKKYYFISALIMVGIACVSVFVYLLVRELGG